MIRTIVVNSVLAFVFYQIAIFLSSYVNDKHMMMFIPFLAGTLYTLAAMSADPDIKISLVKKND